MDVLTSPHLILIIMLGILGVFIKETIQFGHSIYDARQEATTHSSQLVLAGSIFAVGVLQLFLALVQMTLIIYLVAALSSSVKRVITDIGLTTTIFAVTVLALVLLTSCITLGYHQQANRRAATI